MTFEQFLSKYQKEPVIEVPNNRKGREPLVTVKVLAYNHASYIAQCLDSILIQKADFDFEILLSEDESTDGTREICIDYAKRFPEKIRLLLNSRKNNIKIDGKPSGLFNSLYVNYIINSKYITICEGDDYWTDEDSLAKKVSFLEQNDDFVMAFSNFNRLISATGAIQVRPSIKFKENTVIEKEDILSSNIQTVSNVFRNGLIDIYDENMSGVLLGDLILKGKLSHFGKAYYMHDIAPDIYRIHDKGSFSNFSRWQQALQTIKALEYLISHFQSKKQDDSHIVQHLVYFCFHSFLRTLITNKRIEFSLLIKAKKYANSRNISTFKEGFKAISSITRNFLYKQSFSSN